MSRIRAVFATEVLLVLGLLAFIGIAYTVEVIGGFGSAIRLSPLAGIAFSAVPAFLWLTYFYAQDRHEPEPVHYVFGVFLIGAFIAGPVAHFIISSMMSVGDPSSIDRLAPERLVRAFLVIGLAQELCKYIVVRYTIYLSPEFDEPMDGIVYMTAAGIGFATFENFGYFQQLDGEIMLTTAAGHAVVTTLAHACFAGVLGYALGRAKFSCTTARSRTVTLFLGLLAAAILNGQFELITTIVNSSGMKVHPWRGVAYAAGFAAIVFFVTSILMRRMLAISPFRPGAQADGDGDSGEAEASG